MENIQAINPNSVPKVTLASGDQIPAVGLGTFGSDNYTADVIAEAVKLAVKAGYRHIDCAAAFSCPQSFPASGSFQMSQLFASDGQSIGVSASTSVLPMNTQD